MSKLTCRLNNTSDTLDLKLYGYCCEGKLEIANKGQIFFPPSYTGVFTKQKIQFHNKSRVPLMYKINIPEKFADE